MLLKIIKYIHYTLFAVSLTVSGYAQHISKGELEQRAYKNFATNHYYSAVKDFEVLHKTYPKDITFAYYLGRSYLESNAELLQARDLLKYAASRDYSNEAWFYLGLACLRTYSFEDAKLALLSFQKIATSKEIKNYQPDYWLGVIDNMKEAVKIAPKLTVSNEFNVTARAWEAAYVGVEQGTFIYVPEEFRSAADIELDYRSLMYLPNHVEISDYVYFSSYGNKSKGGLQLYRAQRVNNGDYSLPESLPEPVNTQYDDAYPFYHKATQTLYFSSKRPGTSGGYDIFSAQYNSDSDTWTTPGRKGFPLNSVHDDIGFVILNDGNIRFMTNRNSIQPDYKAYTIDLEKSAGYITPSGTQEIRMLANLTARELDEVVITKKEEEIENNSEVVDWNSQDEVDIKKSDIKTDSFEYVVEEAMNLQIKSDSLISIVKKMRIKARDEHNYQRKQELIAAYVSIEKEGKRLQQMADNKFIQAEELRMIEQNKHEAVMKQPDPQTENTHNGITKIANIPDMNSTLEQVKEPKVLSFNTGAEAASSVSKQVTDEFRIMSSSPYSGKNPIPFASIPEGLIYRIQLGAYANNIPANTFRGLSPVAKEIVKSGTKYYVGTFVNIAGARKALKRVHDYGYPDAFLISFYQKERISVQRAREIEFTVQ